MDGQQQQQQWRQSAPYPVQPSSQSSNSNSPQMEGFGSADITTPFNYGSVEDGRYRQDSLEQKIRKKYWKTKQTVIEKLGKSQDEFVVAGDADIDMKLEKAFHLQSSCDQLLSALDKYIARIRAASVHERIMGEHLRTWSETEYTNAGEVMQNVGKIQEGDAKKRLSIEASLQRMQSEFMVFRVTAIRDLGLSIQYLQKARTEYRAALLWMKDVSEKLQNPDYRNQLFKFREAQAAVKESKHRYEKLKFDLGEKIDMVSASRCNLLSRSLPYYQKEILSFYNDAANEFHKILVDLRSHHHHQYKVRRLAEEIRDLEAEESPFSDESGLLGPSGSLDDDVPLLDIGGGGSVPPVDGANEEGASEKKTIKEAPPKKMLGSDQISIEKIQEEAKVKDLALSGIEAELRDLQKEVLQPSSNEEGLPPSSSSPKPSQSDQLETMTAEASADNEFRDLLQLDNDETTEGPPLEAPQSSQDKLFDDWSSFSAFMPTSLERTKSPTSGWEKELLSGSSEDDSLMGLESKDGSLSPTQVQPPSPSQAGESGAAGEGAVSTSDKSLAKKQDQTDSSADAATKDSGDLQKASKESKKTKTGESEPGSSADLLSEDLKALGISPDSTSPTAPPKPILGADMESLDPSYFTQQPPQPPPPTYQQQQLLMPTITGAPQHLPIMPPPSGSTNMMGMVPVTSAVAGQQQQQSAMFRSPQSNSQRPILAAALASSYQMPSSGGVGGAGYPMISSLGSSGAIGGIGGGAGGVGGISPTKAKANGRHVSEKEKEKSASWMNVFAHLDPLVNEKV